MYRSPTFEMKTILKHIAFGTIVFLLFSGLKSKPDYIIGKYVYEVHAEYITYYKSTIWLKRRGKFVKEQIYGVKKTIKKGAWNKKSDTIFLSSRINGVNIIDTLIEKKNSLVMGECGVHIKQ